MAQNKNIDVAKINAHLPGILSIIEQYAESKRVELDACKIADQSVSIAANMNDAKAKAALVQDLINYFKAKEKPVSPAKEAAKKMATKSTPATTSKETPKSGSKQKENPASTKARKKTS